MIQESEYNPYYGHYIKKAYQSNLVKALEDNFEEGLSFLKQIPEEKWHIAYEANKWSIAKVLVHILDTERIFSYRALCFSRNEKLELPGFDQDVYADECNAEDFSKAEVIASYEAVRKQTIMMFKTFSDNMLIRSGVASNSSMSVRAAGYIIIGHQMHHLEVIKDKYLK